jgi:hypothetical protein
MDIKIILSFAITILIIFSVIYEFIKENQKIKKEKNREAKQNLMFEKMETQLRESSMINQEILKYLKYSVQKYMEEITESQVRIVVESILNNSQFEIFNYSLKISDENHIKGNEKEATSKIKLFINNRFHKDYLLLKEFKYKGKTLSEYPMDKWREYLIENILDNILKEKGAKVLYSALQNSYDSFKYDILDKILS